MLKDSPLSTMTPEALDAMRGPREVREIQLSPLHRHREDDHDERN